MGGDPNLSLLLIRKGGRELPPALEKGEGETTGFSRESFRCVGTVKKEALRISKRRQTLSTFSLFERKKGSLVAFRRGGESIAEDFSGRSFHQGKKRALSFLHSYTLNGRGGAYLFFGKGKEGGNRFFRNHQSHVGFRESGLDLEGERVHDVHLGRGGGTNFS